MKLLLLSCIVILAVGCKKAHNLSMADLKFPDYEKEFIAKNGVDSIYRSNKHPGMVFPKPSFYDTLQVLAYNAQGNIIFEYEGFNGNTTWEYDSLGFLKKKNVRSCGDNISYVKYKLRSGQLVETTYYIRRKGPIDSTITATYSFDENGRLLSSNTMLSDVNHDRFNNTYLYDSNGLLIEVKGEDVKRRWRKKANNYSKKIYYTNSIPDSAIFLYTDYEGPRFITIKTYYNDLGLKYKEVKNDTLVTWYKHHFLKPSHN